MRRKCLLVILMTMMIAIMVTGAQAENYKTLKKGDTGKAVLALKTRMYYLGYFTTEKLTDSYNGTTVERVRLLQKMNGLEETGIATPELQELIFSGDCVWMEPTPQPTPVPTPTPPPLGPEKDPEIPDLDEEGFCLHEKEYIYADREDGLWIYKSGRTNAEIRRYEDPYEKIVWFETFINFREGKGFTSLLSEGKIPGRAFVLPTVLAEHNNAVIAFSDDFIGYRITNLKTDILGMVIRQGNIIGTKTKKAESKHWPPLDVFALFEDGTARTFISDEYTSEEYLAMNVTDTYTFGPILVQNGKICEDVYLWSEKSKEPRMGIGYIAPGKYCVLTIVGRTKESGGATLGWMATKMKEMGAEEALNLDGGGTSCLIFDGDVINRSEGFKANNLRKVTTMIGVIRDDGNQ